MAEQQFVNKGMAKQNVCSLLTIDVKYTPLVEPEEILLPPLHIKLEVLKGFVKALDKEGGVFKHLRRLFQQLSEAKGRKYFS
ncbi:hypothetical protein AVEN_93463-1 [Araneus ventricosus]|uniref:Uncharacterized protein n=1 Tax=Araneus ventricosus TaxID=182803 RepID=A0A4Y2AR00_ARAVE|nr:hypothetical protein AVEN_93463-1 [Araneus ventricosus]